MNEFKIEIHDDVVLVLERLRDLRETEIDLEIPEGSVLFENSLALKLIKKEAEKLGKTVNFSTTDQAGLTMIELIEGNGGGGSPTITEDFVSREVALEEAFGQPLINKKAPFKFQMPAITLPAFLSSIKLPKGKAKIVIPVILVLFFLIYWVAFAAPKASVDVIVESQPLIKSIELEVGTALKNDPKQRTLEGKTFTASVTKTKTAETTGEAVVGEKATGRVKILNYTTSDQDFDSGDQLYSVDNDDLYYVLDDDVTVDAATQVTQPDNSKVTTPGSVEVDVTALEVGSDYNLDKNKDLEFEDYDTDDFTAEVVDKVDGGKSEIVSAVTQKDMDDLSAALATEMESDSSLVADSGWILIKGAETSAVTNKEFNHKIDDQADELELKQTATIQGLGYNEDSLNDILDVLLEEFVPEGFELSDEDREVNVEILGNTDSTTLSTTDADLQVTLKAFVLPQIDETKIKEELAGSKLSEAERILGGIRNIKSYEIHMNFKVPFFSRMPSKPENITLTVKKD